MLAVDNTFMSPYFQRPLELGADVVVHSTTKFLNGHSDSIGGVLIAARQEHGEWFAFVQKSTGGDPVAVRLLPGAARHQDPGRPHGAPRAERPRHRRATSQHTRRSRRCSIPGLPDHPGHALQKRQACGFGALITFDLGSFAAAKAFLDRVQVLSLAESLGGVETLTSHPATMTHASVPAAEREKLGITDGLVRISVGIEDLDDLIADIDQALAGI